MRFVRRVCVPTRLLWDIGVCELGAVVEAVGAARGVSDRLVWACAGHGITLCSFHIEKVESPTRGNTPFGSARLRLQRRRPSSR
jgi:hypothetical protein